jgi:AmmeMemoRadiSam system protein B
MFGEQGITIRKPAVAGSFYSSDPIQLADEIKTYINKTNEKKSVSGIISPHAGFMYSGTVAGSVYSAIKIPETVILVGPNHTGKGPNASIMAKGQWKSPLGSVEIDTELANLIVSNESILKIDTQAHLGEHSLEAQLPFLQFFQKDLNIVPICLKRISFEQCESIGQAITNSIRQHTKKVLIVASSDMSHFETHENTVKKDRMAIDEILNLDPKGLDNIVRQNQITMCGVNPAIVMLTASTQLGANQANLIKYKTSGEVNGDMNRVVGYAGMTVK